VACAQRSPISRRVRTTAHLNWLPYDGAKQPNSAGRKPRNATRWRNERATPSARRSYTNWRLSGLRSPSRSRNPMKADQLAKRRRNSLSSGLRSARSSTTAPLPSRRGDVLTSPAYPPPALSTRSDHFSTGGYRRCGCRETEMIASYIRLLPADC
jgi:hypothetical protein